MKVDNEYQKFFRHERFTHHISLPPSYLNEKSVLPVLRKIEFKLNKTFLKSAFSKYAKTDTLKPLILLCYLILQLFPLNCSWWLRCNVIDNSINTFHFIYDFFRTIFQDLIIHIIPMCCHSIYTGNCP